MTEFIEVPANKISIGSRKLVYGFAVNDADYMTSAQVNGKQVRCPYYRKWVNMLRRCYCAKYQKTHPTYIGCSVHTDWHSFSVFKTWMMEQPWQGNDLDKDLLVQGNKVYGPDTCLFLPPPINKLLSNNKSNKGRWPIGVNFNKENGKFKATCRVYGKLEHIGYYDTSEAAYKVYKQFKYKHIKTIALEQSEPLRSALLNYKIAA